MSRTKCGHCGLINASHDSACRRCGEEFANERTQKRSSPGPREAAKNSSWLYTILVLALLAGGATYLFSGVEKSYKNVKADDVNRIAAQPRQTDGLSSRSELEQQRAGKYKNAIQNSSGLAESQKHYEETQKLLQPATANSRK